MKAQTVVGGDRPIGRTDFRDPDRPLVAEINSLTFHSTPSDRDADRRRYAQLLAAGFSVVVVWEDDLWSNTADVARAVAAGRHDRGSGRSDGPPHRLVPVARGLSRTDLVVGRDQTLGRGRLPRPRTVPVG